MLRKRRLVILGAVLLLSAAPVFSSPRKKASQDPTTASGTSAAKARTAPTKKASAKRTKTRRRERGQKAPTPERIREIQTALAREGAYTGEPNGKWDAASVEAMKRFQAAHGLNPTGKFDALSLQKLGLGSQITGVAAPRPPLQPLPAGNAPPQ